MEFIMNYWPLLVAAIAFFAVVIIAIVRFVGLPTESQLAKVREWLLWAVTEAEKELGSGTGALKLRQVYDLFVTRFPWLAKAISFELFSEMVDEALEEMRSLLNTNQAARSFVEGGSDHDGTGTAK